MKIQLNLVDADGCLYGLKEYFYRLWHIIEIHGDFFKSYSKKMFPLNKDEAKELNDTINKIINEMLTYKGISEFDTYDEWDTYFSENIVDDEYIQDFFDEHTDEQLRAKWVLKQLSFIEKIGASKLLDSLFIVANRSWLKSLQNQVAAFDEMVFMVGSSRQSYFTDLAAIDQNGTRSFCREILLIPLYLKQVLEKEASSKIKIDKCLLADIHNHLPCDESFNRILRNEPIGKHCHAVFDETKFTILYNAIHHVAAKNRFTDITVNFYDDRNDILDALYEVFDKHSDLLPKNVVLNLHRYDGELHPEEITTIKGLGKIDFNYRANVIKIANMCVPQNKTINAIDATKQLDFDKFKRERKTLLMQSTSNHSLLGKRQRAEQQQDSISLRKTMNSAPVSKKQRVR